MWFSKGPLFDAIRASIAIPTLIRPHHYQGRLLVDGGLLNPLPVSPTLRDHTEATIAVDVNAVPEPLSGGEGGTGGTPELAEAQSPRRRHRIAEFIETQFVRREKRGAAHEPGAFELFARSLDIVQETITRLKLASQPPDLLITIPRNACAFYEFHRAEELIELGRQRTREALARWLRMET